MGDVGAVASLIETVAKWFLSDAGYAAFTRKRHIAKLVEEAERAVDEQRWADLDAISARLDELRREQAR